MGAARTISAAAVAGLLACCPTALAAEAELVTVTTDSAEATWTTSSPMDTTVCWGRTSPGEHCETQERDAVLHHAVLGGLRAGTGYVYELRSGGVAEPPTLPSPGSFTTLTPPGGRHLFDFALMNDTHVGEGCAGTAFNEPLLGSSVPPCFSAPDYAARMDAGMVQEIAARGIGLTIVNGDVTAEARPAELEEAQQVLAGLPGTVLVARGNHDRVHHDDAHAGCGDDDDCFRAAFHPDSPPGRIYGSTDYRGYHFVMLDSVKGSSTGDLTDAAQNAWLARDLAVHRSQPTFVFFHHPASEYGDTFQEEPVIFGVPPWNGGSEFLHTVAENPQIVGVLQAHTHRNFNSYGLEAGNRTPFIENGTSKEYPGGYSVFSVYQGGYTRSYFRPRDCAFCREWTETTRQEYFGLAPQYLLGSLGTRNFSHVYDCHAQIPATSLPGQESLLTGGVITPPRECLDRSYPEPGSSPEPEGRRSELRSRTVRIRRARGSLRLRCASEEPCAVRGRLTVRGRTLARVRGTVAAGRTGRVRVTLKRAGRSRLARRRRVRTRAHLLVQTASLSERLEGRITLVRQRPHRANVPE